jgi:hypothetical protein
MLKKKSLMIIFANPKDYLNIIFTARELSNNFTQNHILCFEDKKKFYGAVDFGKSKVSFLESKIFTKFYYFNLLLFFVKCFVHYVKFKPDILIGYNSHGIITSYILSKLFKKPFLISHNFDFEEPESYKGNLRKFLFKLELLSAGKSDLVILPNKSRANIYSRLGKIKKSKIDYMLNSYPINFKIKKSKILKKYLLKNKINYKKIIIRLGHFGPYHAIENLIRSALYWKDKFILILAGHGSVDYIHQLNKLIKDLDLQDKIIIFRSVTYKFWYDILFSGDLGVCLYEEKVLSHKHMEGTSQKLNNYLLANIPMLTNDNSEFKKFNMNYKCNILADTSSPILIAKAINSVLINKNYYKFLSKKSRIAFQDRINFNYQFKRVFIDRVFVDYNE